MSKRRSRSNLALLTMMGITLACSNPDEGGEQGVGTVSNGSTSAATTATSDLPSTGSPTDGSSTSGSSDDASSISDTACIGCPADLPQLGSCSIWDNDCPVRLAFKRAVATGRNLPLWDPSTAGAFPAVAFGRVQGVAELLVFPIGAVGHAVAPLPV